MKRLAASIAAVVLFATPAAALTFNFTVTGNASVNNVPDGTGTIAVTIDGLLDNKTNQATPHFIIDSVSPFSFSQFCTPVDLVTAPGSVGGNDFTVASGILTNGVFTYQDAPVVNNPGIQISFGIPASGGGLQNGQGFIQISDALASQGTWLIFAPINPTDLVSATPLPATLPMFFGGAGLIGLLARRRKRDPAIPAA